MSPAGHDPGDLDRLKENRDPADFLIHDRIAAALRAAGPQ